jgi:hypothetical protein
MLPDPFFLLEIPGAPELSSSPQSDARAAVQKYFKKSENSLASLWDFS